MATKVFLGMQVFLLSMLVFANIPTRSASTTTTTTAEIEVYAGTTAENCTSHGATTSSSGTTEESSKEDSGGCCDNKNIDDANTIPPSFDAPFGSYPNLLKITNDERDSFSPVVFFPGTPRNSNNNSSSNKHVAVKDHTRSSGELASIEAIERKRSLKKKNYQAGFLKVSSGVVSACVQNAVAFVRRRIGSEAFPVDEDHHRRDPPQQGQQQRSQWAIGKYDENRDGGMYESDLFDDLANTIDGYGGRRTVHLGMDLGGPVGTPVHAFSDGIVHSVGYNPDLGDYGYVIVVEHFWGAGGDTDDGTETDGRKRCWALYGHLDGSTLTRTIGIGEDGGDRSHRWWTRLLLPPGLRKRTVPVKAGDFVRKGTILGRMGDIDENGGWIKPHLHFQLSTKPPDQPHDMPGASSVKDRVVALRQYPDPRYVLGPLY